MTIQLPQLRPVTGMVLWKGPSLINGKEIVAILTGLNGGSHNSKTGKMLQIFIINTSINPIEALKNGEDKSVCGDCIHRKLKTCYVSVFQSVNQVYKTYQRGNYTQATDELIVKHLTGQNIRFGAYGDPAAVPIEVWDKILAVKGGHTAYTHQFSKSFAQPYKKFCMASVDNPREYAKAKALGWRTFRVRLASEPLLKREFVCPASIEGGKRLTCETCGACNGGSQLGTVAIVIHGTSYKPRRFIAVRKRQISKHGWQDLVPI